jgi:DNA ligase D-like protein (predicted 3'-phosphoesterase)
MARRRRELTTYGSKRDFRKTPEPSGDGRRGGPPFSSQGNPIFVIQQHDASSHHWDFRLEVDGVLKSWAVPKGPSTDPREKRLAVATADHPLDYADFEGVIPEGQYGGGTVIVWDAGPYKNLRTGGDGEEIPMRQAVREGRAEVWLEGKKLRGGYALVHSRLGGKQDNWLLVKMKDAGADARRRPVHSQPRSVLSGCSIEELAREGAEDEDQ